MMDGEMNKTAIILTGVPGSGKGMQADLIADRLGLVHLDTGKILRAILHDGPGRNDSVLKRERELNNAGFLNTPSWVLAILKKKVAAMAKLGYGVVFSGSPRTMYEAGGLVPFLEKLFGKKNVYLINLRVPFTVAAKRNSLRLVCATCRRPLLLEFYPLKNPRHCPVCGGMLERRTDDDPLKFKTRTEEYQKRTLPILEYMKLRGYKIIKIDGTPPPYKVFQKINASFKNRKRN